MRRLLPALPAVLVLAAFAPALRGGFVNWDDPGNIVDNPWLATPQVLLRAFTSTHYGHFQPLAWLSLALDRALWGLDPFGYHLTALLLHAASAVALALLLMDLTGGTGTPVRSAIHRTKFGKDLTGVPVPPVRSAVLAASLWAVHPLRVEAVAWATERRELLATLFLLVSARHYVAGRRGAALLAFAAAGLSKVTSAVFPLALLCYDHWKARDPREAVREKAPFFAISAIVLILGVRAQYLSGTAVPLALFGPAERLAQAAFAPGYYAVKTLLPISLNPFVYVDWRSETSRFHPYAVLFVPFLVSLWFNRRRRSFMAVSAAMLLFLAPSLGFFKSGPQSAADRFAHMASVPLAIAAAFALARSARARLAAGLALLALIPLTRAQCAVWRDSVSLWTRAYEASTRPTPLVVQNLAVALREAGREAEAGPLLARVQSEAPQSPAAFAMRGEAAYEGGDFTAAEGLFAEALSRNPDMPGVRVNHGLALFRLGRFAEAEAEFSLATRQAPGSADAWHNLGLCLARRGEVEPAGRALSRALALSPGREDTLRVRALLERGP